MSQPCDCEPPPEPLTPMQVVSKYTVFSLKGAVTVGIIYWTMTLGIWGGGKEAEEFYLGLIRLFNHKAEDRTPMTDLGDIKAKVLNLYNQGLITTMKFLVHIPLTINNYVKNIIVEPKELTQKDK